MPGPQPRRRGPRPASRRRPDERRPTTSHGQEHERRTAHSGRPGRAAAVRRASVRGRALAICRRCSGTPRPSCCSRPYGVPSDAARTARRSSCASSRRRRRRRRERCDARRARAVAARDGRLRRPTCRCEPLLDVTPDGDHAGRLEVSAGVRSRVGGRLRRGDGCGARAPAALGSAAPAGDGGCDGGRSGRRRRRQRTRESRCAARIGARRRRRRRRRGGAPRGGRRDSGST